MSDANLRLSVLDAPVCCADDLPPAGTRFHIALNVANLHRAVEFYRILFGTRPAKQFPDYAKFELNRPPFVFSLVPNPPGSGASLRRLGFPVHHPSEVEAVGMRLSTAGLAVTWQKNATSDYSRRHIVQVADPEGNTWQVYCVLEDVESSGRPNEATSATVPEETAPRNGQPPALAPNLTWEHRVTAPCPQRIPHANDSIDQVRLEGTWNADFTAVQRMQLLAEAQRVLKPGGIVQVHGLVSDRSTGSSLPPLPGVAALVRRVPVEREPFDELRQAGFVGLHVTKLPQAPVFRCGAIEMRELKLFAYKPQLADVMSAAQRVIYKGPFSRVTDDGGRVYQRGDLTVVDAATAAELRREPLAQQFLFVDDPDPDESVAACHAREDQP